jgi:hypothetical protein
MSTGRICLFRGNATTDGNVDRIGIALAAGFTANGWEAEVVDLSEGDAVTAFNRAVTTAETKGLDFFLSVEGMGSMGGLETLLANTGARQLYWALDHPHSGLERLRKLTPGSVATFPTRTNLACCRDYIRPDLVLAMGAHGAEPCAPLPWSRRDIDILFVGNAGGPGPSELRRGWKDLPPPWNMVLEAMAEGWAAAPHTPPETLARNALTAAGTTGINGHDFFAAQRMFDDWARGEVRHVNIPALAGLPLTLVGRGWEGLAQAEHTVLGPRPADEVSRLVGRARLTLNLLPDYYLSHERVFSAMAAGTAVATTGSGCLANALGLESHPADDTAIGHLPPSADRPEYLRALWADQGALAELADAGLDEFRHHHTWERRVAGLLAAIGRQPPSQDS